MSWFYLILAGVLEIFWAIGLKYTDGFKNPLASVLVVVSVAASLFLLALAAKQIPIGIAYAIWVGIGVLGTTLIGALLFREPLSIQKGLFLGLLMIALVGIKMAR